MLQDTAMLLHQYGYLVIFVVLAVEGTGMPGIPLEIVFLGAGYLIQHGQMRFEYAVAAAALGNTLGNLVGYFTGAALRVIVRRRWDALDRPQGHQNAGRARRSGDAAPRGHAPDAMSASGERCTSGAGKPSARCLSKGVRLGASDPSSKKETQKLPGRLARKGLLSRVDLSAVEDWFCKYGSATVFIGRWFGPIRTPAILASGFIGIDIRKYLAASALASFSWCLTWQLGAWKLGEAVVRLLEPHALGVLWSWRWDLLAAGVLLATVALLALRLVPRLGAPK